MRMSKSRSLSLTALTALLCLTCEKVPDFCGDGELYNPDCAFCYGSQPYLLCANEKREYNPLVQGCVPTTNVVGTRCSDGSVVKTGTPCGGYTLTTAVTPEGVGKLDPPPDKTKFAAGESLFLNAVPTNADYEFTGWAGALTLKDNGKHYDVMKGSNPQVLIVAMFKPKSAGKLITDAFPQGAGEVTRMPDKEVYEDGEDVLVTATANTGAGYAFDGWSGADVPNKSTVTVKMNRNEGGKTLVAIFTPIVHTLSAVAEPADGGAVYINSTAMLNGELRGVGTEVAVWARAMEGYAFSQWTGTGATFADDRSSETVVKLEADAVITARFTRGGGGTVAPPQGTITYTLNVYIATDDNGDAGGSVSLSSEGPYTAGTVVTATATADDGYKFDKWLGASTSADTSVNITMSGNKTLMAYFVSEGTDSTTAQTYTLTVNRNPSDGGTTNISSQGNISAGTQVPITATAALGYTFGGWVVTSGSGTIDNAGSAATTVTVNGNVIVTANFTQTNTGGDSYESVVIGSQKWMKENLNISTSSGSWCYDNDPSNCEIYGRLYDWNTAMTVCPTGWHLPSRTEWDELSDLVGDSKQVNWRTGSATGYYWPSAGTKLKSTSGWYENYGTDAYKFSALSGGLRNSGGSFDNADYYGYWWTATEFSDGSAYYRDMYYYYDDLYEYYYGKDYGFSVRCVSN